MWDGALKALLNDVPFQNEPSDVSFNIFFAIDRVLDPVSSFMLGLVVNLAKRDAIGGTTAAGAKDRGAVHDTLDSIKDKASADGEWAASL